MTLTQLRGLIAVAEAGSFTVAACCSALEFDADPPYRLLFLLVIGVQDPTPIHTLGNPIGLCLSGGQAHDLVGADRLLPSMRADVLIADKAFDANQRVLDPLAAAEKTAVIPSKANRRRQRPFDRNLYKARHLIKNFFAKLKQYRAIATRYDKTARKFLAAVVWLN